MSGIWRIVLIGGAGTAFLCVGSALSAQQSPAPDRCMYAGDCLAAFEVDLDQDDKPDNVELVSDRRLWTYRVHVRTSRGKSYTPFSGRHDAASETVSLTLRQGAGDIRCESWTSGAYCGFPQSSHDQMTSPALYLSHSRHGNFLLKLIFPNLFRPRPRDMDWKTFWAWQYADAYFEIMPAIEGPTTRDVQDLRRRP